MNATVNTMEVMQQIGNNKELIGTDKEQVCIICKTPIKMHAQSKMIVVS